MLGLSAGIALGHFIRFNGLETCTAAVLSCGLTYISWKCSLRLLIPCFALAFSCFGILLDIFHPPALRPQLDAGPRETVVLDGCVVSPSAFSEGRDQFVMELAPGARVRVTIALREDETPPLLDYGQRVELDGRVRPVRNFRNPGEFDYESFSARSGVYWTASATGAGSVAVQAGRCGSRFFAAVFALRGKALTALERLYAHNAYALGMMEATLIGESSRMERIWTDHFRRTGTYHMLVIDGLHITVLAAFLLFLLRLCFVPEVAALAVTASGAWLYALISGWNAPAIRAAGGFLLYAIARYFYRRGRILNLLAAVAIVYLAFDPSQLFEAGFQLSFLAVAAIALLAVPVLEATSTLYGRALAGITDPSRAPRLAPRAAQFRLELRLLAETLSYYIRLPRSWCERAIALAARALFYAFGLAVISAAIQIGLAIPMAIYFHRISLTGISANILVVPLLALVVPLGFLAVLTTWSIPAAIAGGLLRAGERIAEWHTHLEPEWRVLAPPLWLAVAFTAGLLLLALALDRAMERSLRAALAPWMAVLTLFALIFWHPFPPRMHRGELEVSAIDVGQGDSLLVAFPDSKLMLIDAGGVLSFGRHTPARLDIGEDVVSPYLWSRSIRKLDVVALTHAHDDHAGGLPAVIENFHPGELWTGAIAPSAAWSAVRAQARTDHVRIVRFSSGRRFVFGGALIEVISPPPDYVPSAAPTNNDSLALRITYGRRSFLLTGDMEKPMERRALIDGEPLRADILKVGHHGSNTSSIDPFLSAVAPVFAVISDGYANSFGHPNPKVLERLSEHRAQILRTDRDGLVTVRTDGRRIWVETFRLQSASYRLSLLPESTTPEF